MPDAFADISNAQFLGIPTIYIIVGFIAIILLLIYKNRHPKKPAYKMLSAEQEIKKKHKDLIKTMGVKVNKKLMYGMEWKGWLGKCAEKEQDTKVYELYVHPLSRLKQRLHIRKNYIIIPNDAIHTNPKEIEIMPMYKYNNEMGEIVIGRPAKDTILDDGYKVAHEQAINSMINWLPLQAYLSVQHAQSSETLDHIAEIEKSKRQDAINDMTGKSKK